jgi:gliding motility-associated-like protein
LTVSANVLPVGCANVNDGSILAVANGGTAPYNYNWSNDATSANNAQLSTGNFDLTVTDSKGCTVSNKWSIGTTPQIAVSGAVKNTSCPSVENGAIDITITGGTPNFSINWNNGETVQNISQLAQGAYQVVVTDSRSCTAQATFNISYDYILTVDAGNYTNINLGETATLTATANGNNNNVYNWSPSVNVECAACATTTTRSGNNTTFTINVTDDYGCTAFDTVSVSVNSITDLFIPNAFTPNNDGNNDVLEIYGDINAIHYIEFNIFNRWGEKVFSTNDPTFKWDGSYKGQMVDQGAYIYTMNLVFINEVSRSDYKGSITIIR